MLFRCLILIKIEIESRLHYIGIIAYHRIKRNMYSKIMYCLGKHELTYCPLSSPDTLNKYSVLLLVFSVSVTAAHSALENK